MLGLGNALTHTSEREQVRYSLVLDGSGDYLDTGNAYQSTFRDSFSFAFFMKPDDGQPSSAENLLGSDNSADEDAFFISLTTAGKIKIDHEANDDPASYITDAAVYGNGAGTWKHICVTVTKDTNTSYIIYVNGSAVAGTLTNAVAEAAHAAWTSSDELFIGALDDNGTATAPFTGKIDDVAFWNVALDAAAAAVVKNRGLSGKDLTLDKGNYDNSSALVGYWRLNDGSGTTAYDSSGNGNHGTLEGDPTFSTDTPDD